MMKKTYVLILGTISLVFFPLFLFDGYSRSLSPDIFFKDHTDESSFSYQIKEHNGTPTLHIDGKPVFYGMWWLAAPEEDQWIRSDFVRENAEETGIHIYAFDVGRHEWAGPGEGRSGHFDFSTVEARLKRICDVDPKARFHLRIYLEMNEHFRKWWHDLYPDEVEICSDGTTYRQSFASKVWRKQAKEFLNTYIAHLQKIGLADRIVSYQVGAGHTGEWVKGKVSMYDLTGDYSEPMQRHFRAWLERRYKRDVQALQNAWNDPEVTFETAVVPSDAEQLSTQHFTFRDPRKEQNVIDYYICLADLCGDLIIDFCRTVKEATNGRSLAGAFYGYLMELAWNAGFFSEGPDSEYSTYQRSGHLGLDKVLRSPHIDFLVSPYSYGFRGIGGEGCSMLPTESLRIHNKLYIFEDDTRTHTDIHPAYGRARNLEESEAILRRNLAYVLTHGQGIWWLVNKGAVLPSLEPAFQPLLKQFQEVGRFALGTDRTPTAEVAVLLDDESFLYQTVKNDLDFPLIFKQRLTGLPRMGAPYDVYLLDDFIEGRLRPYKLYIFLNAFRLDENRRAGLKKELRRDGRVAVWIYAPGYIKDIPSLENMTDLTGFGFAKNDHPWPSYLSITDFDHPITSGLSQDLFWGTDSRLGPQFQIQDPEAKILGQVVCAQGTCQPGFGLKTFPEWTSIYIAVPNIPASVLRSIARFAKVHLYSEKGDVIYASSNLLAVHTVAGGKRSLRLPHRVEVVYNFFEREITARNTDRFDVNLDSSSTAFYYIGNSSLLSSLEELCFKPAN
jgi:hypothetical protein